jgi:DNA-binding response OmpR family regulator
MDSQRAPDVLVIDDDPDIQFVLTELLDLEGYAFRTASNGLLGLDQVSSHLPGLILLDLRMPVMDGWTFLRAMRERGLSSPIIILSAELGLSDPTSEFPTVTCLAKPFYVQELLAAIEKYAVPRRTDRTPPRRSRSASSALRQSTKLFPKRQPPKRSASAEERRAEQ